ncbi:MAG: DUF4340 domain-containing protein [Verrucomicrobia bacterium]|nr:DUF4340 domain-containing protein [Verrucomicrobiota bacterium]
MKLRTTITLVMIALGLGLFIYVLDRRNPSRHALQIPSGYVIDIDPRAVDHLLIQDGENTIELRRAADGWIMQQPLQDLADAAVIEQLLGSLEFLRPEDVLLDLGHGEKKKQKLRDFGLLKPRLRLRLDGPGRTWDLGFGNNTAVEGSSYLRVQGKDPVYVVPNAAKDFLTRNPNDFRDHRISPFLTAQIDRVELRANGGLIVLHKTQDDWEMDRPIKARASNDRMAQLLAKVSDATIQEFVDLSGDALGEMGGQTTALVLGAGDQQVALTFGAVRSAHRQLVAISGRPKAFLIDPSVQQALEMRPNDLRDRKIARLNPDLIDRITIRSGKDAFTLARREDQWFFADDRQPVNPEAVSRLFQSVTTQEVAAFVNDAAVDLARYGLDQPGRSITFSSYASENTAETTAGETPVCNLSLGKSENGATYARLDEEPYVFSIADSALAGWPTSQGAFRSLSLFQFQRGDLTEVTIQRPGQPPIRLGRGADGRWQKDGRTDPGEEPEIQTFLNTLVTLRAKKWVDDDLPHAGLDAPQLTVTLHLRTPMPSTEVVLRIGSAVEQSGYVASLSSSPGQFLLGEQDCATLTRL